VGQTHQTFSGSVSTTVNNRQAFLRSSACCKLVSMSLSRSLWHVSRSARHFAKSPSRTFRSILRPSSSLPLVRLNEILPHSYLCVLTKSLLLREVGRSLSLCLKAAPFSKPSKYPLKPSETQNKDSYSNNRCWSLSKIRMMIVRWSPHSRRCARIPRMLCLFTVRPLI